MHSLKVTAYDYTINISIIWNRGNKLWGSRNIYILICRISRAHWVNTWRCIFSVTRKFKGCLHSVFAFCCMLGLYKHTVKVMPFFCRKSWSKIHIILMYYNGACILPLSKLPTVQQHGAESRRHVGCRWSFIHVQLLGGKKHYFFFFEKWAYMSI